MIKVQKKSQPQYANRGEGRQGKKNSGNLCGARLRVRVHDIVTSERLFFTFGRRLKFEPACRMDVRVTARTR